jgi:hypothetical protein
MYYHGTVLSLSQLSTYYFMPCPENKGKVPEQYVLRQTWFIPVCTETNMVHTVTNL